MAHPTYRLKDKTRVPSVTTILSRFKEAGGLLHWAWQQGVDGKDYRETRDAAATAGSFAHEMIEASVLGRPPVCPTVAETGMTQPEYDHAMALAGQAFGGFLEWREVTRIEIVATETSLVSESFRFGGTPDAVGVGRGGTLALLDWKTSNKVYADYVLQIAAYCHLWFRGDPINGAAPPPRLGERIESVHLLRIGKQWGDFHHHMYPREMIELGWRQFVLLREAFDIDKQLTKAV